MIPKSKETFSKGFMIVAGFVCNGKLKIKRMKKNVEINSTYFQEYILFPISKYENPFLYPQYTVGVGSAVTETLRKNGTKKGYQIHTFLLLNLL